MHINLLQRVEPLLCNDLEIGGYTRAISGRRLGKYVPAATEELCFLCGPCRDIIKHETRLEFSEFCTGVFDERTGAPEAEESPLLEAFAKERLVKARKFLAVAVVISGGAVIACSSESCV
jgi:hypothetical protein